MIAAQAPANYWAPHVTVAAIVERDSQFLMVEEQPNSDGAIVINQPAGHLEPGESLVAAVIREVREETGFLFSPEGIIGLYHWQNEQVESFLRIAFHGQVEPISPAPELDSDIVRVAWFSRAALDAPKRRLRSPLVTRCLDDYLNGTRHPLNILVDI